MKPPRVALFTDCFHEVNGAAHTFRHLQAFAERRGLPLLSIHSGPKTRCFTRGPITTLELQRGWAAFDVDVDFGFDPLLWRHWGRIGTELAAFKPDLIHIISPGDFSILGAIWAHKLGIPVVGSFHTNLHQFASARLRNTLRFLPAGLRRSLCRAVEIACGRGLLKYYEIPRLSLAPNAEIQEWLERGTGRVSRLMRRGVNTELFNPARRRRQEGEFWLGFVGRLMREKNVRLLVDLEQALIDAGRTDYRFVIVGHGAEREWLEQNLRRAEFTGVLRDEALAQAYANMDLFVFPSRTDAFGNVVLEAQACGVPALVSSEGGPRHIITPGVTGFVAKDAGEFASLALKLISDPERLQQMKVAARQAARFASWDQVLEEVWESYELCLHLPGRKHPLLRNDPVPAECLPEAECKPRVPA